MVIVESVRRDHAGFEALYESFEGDFTPVEAGFDNLLTLNRARKSLVEVLERPICRTLITECKKLQRLLAYSSALAGEDEEVGVGLAVVVGVGGAG